MNSYLLLTSLRDRSIVAPSNIDFGIIITGGISRTQIGKAFPVSSISNAATSFNDG